VAKELRIGVPGAGQASGVPAFAVSRDSAGILIGVRDNAAPQFAVSRDSDGLLLSALPTGPTVPPLPTSYVASGYVLGINSTALFELEMLFWDAAFALVEVGGGAGTRITSSLTDWQRICVTSPVPAGAAYISARIYCQIASPAGAYWTAMQVEDGVVASAYNVGGANLVSNPEFTPDFSYWSTWGMPDDETSDPLYPSVFSQEASLPSSPLPGITTALKYQSDAYYPSPFPVMAYQATQRTIALPTP